MVYTGLTASVETRDSSRVDMDLLEYRLLRAGEEEAALNFFYSNFVAKEGQLSSVGAGRNEEVTRDMQTMIKTGAPIFLTSLKTVLSFRANIGGN